MRIKQEELQTRKKYIHKGMFTNYVSDRRGGKGFGQMLTLADKGGKWGLANADIC